MSDAEISPAALFEHVRCCQEAVLDLRQRLRWGTILWLGLVILWGVGGWEKLWGVLGVGGVLLMALIYIQRQIRRITQLLEAHLSELYLHHKSRAPQTCGSIDPHLTQAR